MSPRRQKRSSGGRCATVASAGSSSDDRHRYSQFIADFFCFECSLVVELDGDSHAERAREDVLRTKILERDGLRVIRFYNCDVFEHLDAVLEAILRECERRSTPDAPSP